MSEIVAPLPTQQIIILGIAFSAPAPYTEGHVCSPREARVLNSELGENLRNNFAKRVKLAKAAANGTPAPEALAALRAEFAAYAEQYRFGEGRAPRGGDPLMQAALEIARSAVRAHWRKRGLVPEEMRDKFEQDVAKVSMLPQVQEEAQRRVDAMLAAADVAIGNDAASEMGEEKHETVTVVD